MQTFSVAIAEDGTYNVPAITAGTYKVCVETASLRPGQSMMTTKPPSGVKNQADIPAGGSSPKSDKSHADRYVMIPFHYAQPDTTDLTYEVKSGSQTYNIELK
jgi:hypothetical protein